MWNVLFFFVENSNVSFTTSNRWTGDGINCRIRNNTSLLAIVYLCDIKKIMNRMLDQMNSLKFMHYPTELFCAVWLVRTQGVVDEKIRSIFLITRQCAWKGWTSIMFSMTAHDHRLFLNTTEIVSTIFVPISLPHRRLRFILFQGCSSYLESFRIHK